MPAKTIGTLLGACGELLPVRERAHALLALERAYRAAAPRELVAASRVKGLRSGTLIVGAVSPAAAAKLRQLTPRLLRALRAAEPGISGLRIEVEMASPARTEAKPPPAPLTEDAVERFAELAARVPAGGLRNALERLVRHHRTRG
jgi:hypothetical protein